MCFDDQHQPFLLVSWTEEHSFSLCPTLHSLESHLGVKLEGLQVEVLYVGEGVGCLLPCPRDLEAGMVVVQKTVTRVRLHDAGRWQWWPWPWRLLVLMVAGGRNVLANQSGAVRHQHYCKQWTQHSSGPQTPSSTDLVHSWGQAAAGSTGRRGRHHRPMAGGARAGGQ